MSIWTGFTFLANVFEGEFNRCLPKVFLTSSAKSVCFSAKFFLGGTWTELACLQYLSGELNQCLLEVSPTACLSVSSSGSLGFLLRRASRRFSCLLPSVSKQSYPQELRSFCHSVSLCVWVFPLFLMELVSNLLLFLEDANWMSSLVSFKILFQNLSDLLLIFPHTNFFYQDCISATTYK